MNPHTNIAPRAVSSFDQEAIRQEVHRRHAAVQAALIVCLKEKGHAFDGINMLDGRYLGISLAVQHRHLRYTNRLYFTFKGIYRRLDARTYPEPKAGFDIAKIADLIIARAVTEKRLDEEYKRSIQTESKSHAFYKKMQKVFEKTCAHVTQADPEHVKVELRLNEAQAQRLREALPEILQ